MIINQQTSRSSRNFRWVSTLISDVHIHEASSPFILTNVSFIPSRAATQAAIGLAAVHNSDIEGIASIAHTDISPMQFIKVNNRYKLNDFNRARFLRWSQTKKQACTYKVGKNPGTNRAPEEYQYLEQTEKVRCPESA